MPISFAARHTLRGFDPSATPKWQMVPVGFKRTVIVSDAGGLVPRLRPSGIATLDYRRVGSVHHLEITGVRAGRGWVEFVPNAGFIGPVEARNTLELSVKKELQIWTAFHYVKDNAGHKTSRKIADLDTLITGANRLLDAQANVRLLRKSAREITVPKNLGSVVRYSSHLPGVPASQHEWDDVTAFADSAAKFNVFFVWSYEQDDTPNVNNTRAGTIASEKNCLMQDKINGSHAETLAHETVHLLGIGPHSKTAGHLIAPGSVRNGQHITRGQANQINTSGT